MIKFNEVTWYSKLLAGIFIFGVVPVISFFIGMQYEEVVSIPNTQYVQSVVEKQVKENDECSSALGQQEMNNCSGEKLRDARDRLKTLYEKVLQDDREIYNGANGARIKKSQELWESFVESECSLQASQFEGGSLKPFARTQCEIKEVKNRIQNLEEFQSNFVRAIDFSKYM